MIGIPLSGSRVAEWGHAFSESGGYGDMRAMWRVRAAVGCVGATALHPCMVRPAHRYCTRNVLTFVIGLGLHSCREVGEGSYSHLRISKSLIIIFNSEHGL